MRMNGSIILMVFPKSFKSCWQGWAQDSPALDWPFSFLENEGQQGLITLACVGCYDTCNSRGITPSHAESSPCSMYGIFRYLRWQCLVPICSNVFRWFPKCIGTFAMHRLGPAGRPDCWSVAEYGNDGIDLQWSSVPIHPHQTMKSGNLHELGQKPSQKMSKVHVFLNSANCLTWRCIMFFLCVRF